MRIAFITGLMGNGGAERVISVLANCYAETSHEVFVIAIAGGPCEYEMDDRATFISNDLIPRNRIKRVFQRLTFLRNRLRNINPEVVISFCTEVNIYSAIATIGLPFPLVLSERNDPTKDPSSKIARYLRDFIYPIADGFVFQTPNAKSFFSERVQDRAAVLPNPIKDGLPMPYNGTRDGRVVCVARLEAQKNIPLLLEAFRIFYSKHDDFVLELYGRGSQEQYLKRLSTDLGIENAVRFKGYSANVQEDIRRASIFVLSSDYEGIPNAMIEAMALGIPTIATDCPSGGPQMYVKNNINGLLVDVGDVDGLAEAMDTLAKNSGLAARLGRNSSSIREELDSKKVCSMWMDYLRQIVEHDSACKR